MRSKNIKILIATGGTGGHVMPANGLAKHLIENNFLVDITVDNRGLKYLKKSRNYNVKIISSSTIFQRSFFTLILSFLRILKAIIISIIYLLHSRPNMIFGMGGYSSFPVCIAAKIIGIPFIIYENNLILGKTNKYLLPFAKKIIISYGNIEGIKSQYKSKIVVTGNIIRKEILELKKKNFSRINQKLSLLILGGSQAAKVFAEKLPKIIIKCTKEKLGLKIYQQCLDGQKKSLSAIYRKNKIDFKLFSFTKNITNYLYKSNLVITRSGASMSAELINCKIPFISIPLPTSADNHQLKNALYYKKKGFSFLIEESQIDKNLFQLIKSICKDKSLLKKTIKKQNQYSDVFVYKKIDKVIKSLIYEKY